MDTFLGVVLMSLLGRMCYGTSHKSLISLSIGKEEQFQSPLFSFPWA